ncbi:hypothetical protein LOTGIDRAFT_175063 [Lottia gigantea]|uniref:Methyltransferase domain-containing protein n=1 Tax=Lottia gigantea TaxID=225164 RepID=V4C304_LOTGI|nr:hypothetical protein LOTGIDRAFT_175063 [Lottia gigantea]ESO95874.1 hypothetical protein LOTGIDRAFT_175063 [Lottia gigantea]
MATDATKTAAFKKFYQEEDGSLHYMNSIKQREGMSREEVAGTFDKWVEKGTYIEDVNALNYQGPQMTAKVVAELFQKNRENIRMVDMAAGTGLLSVELRKYGFIQIDGVDPSIASEKTAMEKNLYGRYIVEFVDERPLKIRTDEYDCAVSSGGFAPGLMPCAALQEFIRVVKPGGFIVISAPEYIFTLVEEYKGRLEPLMEKYIGQGIIERVSRTRVESYLDKKPGVIFVFQVLQSRVP